MTIRRSLTFSRVIASLGALAAIALSAPVASAVTVYTWLGTTTNWSTTTNWGPTGIPTINDAVFLPATVTSNMPTITTSGSAAQVIFASVTGGWSINGSGLTLTTGTAINAASTTSGVDTINVNVNIAHTSSFSIGTGGTLAFMGSIGNNSPITQGNGHGTVEFGAANTYNGVYTVGQGNLLIAANNVLAGASGTNATLVWASGGTLATTGSFSTAVNLMMNTNINFNGNLTTTGTMQLSGTGQASGQQTIILANNANWNISSSVIDTSGTVGGLALSATTGATSATVTLSGANTFSKGVSVGSSVTLNSNNNSALGTGTLTLTAGSTLGNTSGAAVTNTNAISVTGSANINTPSNMTQSGVISGAGGVTLGGTGTVTLAGANTYTGATTVNAGTLLVQGSVSGSTAVTVAGGGAIGVGKAAGANSFGTLNVASMALTGSSTSSALNFTMGNSGVSDSCVTSGSISITGGGAINLVLILDSGVSDLSGNYTLLTWGSGSVIAPGQVDLTGSSVQIQLDIFNGTYALQDVGNSLDLVAVPEPATWALLGCGLSVTGLAWRRKRR